MLLFSVHKSDKGFTLIESLIIVAIIGILAAIAAPSFLAFLNRSRVNDALASVEGALKEAQSESIKRSTSCTVTLDHTNYKVTGPCLVTGERDLCEKRNAVGSCIQPKALITINTSNTFGGANSNQITYGFRGNTTNGGTVVLSRTDSNTQKCLVTSVGIGLLRTGNYNGSVCNTE